MGFMVPPSKWEVQHARQIFAAQAYQSANGGQLPETRLWKMLEFRHGLNSARFNLFHPNIGRMIESQDDVPTPLPQVPGDPQVEAWVMPPLMPPMQIVNVPPGGTGSNPNPGEPVPQTLVPEPASILMFAAAVLVMGLGLGRFRRRSA